VLSVGNCGADHAALQGLIEGSFRAEVVPADGPADALETLRRGDVALVLVNRRLDRDGSEGLEVIRRIKSDAQLARTPVMLLTNFPEHQQVAVAAGAEPGFGKAELNCESTRQALARFLAAADAPPRASC
jgi:CheY-like chemotaxis protein